MEVIRYGTKSRVLCSSTLSPRSASFRHSCLQARVVRRDVSKTASRNDASHGTLESQPLVAHPATGAPQAVLPNPLPPLSIMPASMLLRSLMITSVLASPRLLNFCMPIMKRMSSSKSILLNPDRNILLHTLMRRFFYDHFCAGENDVEVKQAVKSMRELGYKGVILGYAKEVEPSMMAEAGKNAGVDPIIEDWRIGTLRTLEMLGEGDFLAIKFTGAGPAVIEAMATGAPMPEQLRKGLMEICEAAKAKETKIWVDAEQQKYQATIDDWTIEMMRLFNTKEVAIIYNTFQTYLKSTPSNIARHLQLAADEGWALGLKLVRGAYIASEPRQLIHDTKEDTDAAFDACTADLLTQKFTGFTSASPFPNVELFLATHNEASVKKAAQIQRQRVLSAQPLTPLGYGQLQGMADEISCELLQMCQCSSDVKNVQAEALKPKAFKFSCWGSVQECMQYLLRRAVENQGAIERTKLWAAAFRGELWRRVSSAGR